jgi:hypothetical protein
MATEQNSGSANVTPSVEEITERIRTLNDQIIDAAKSTGGAWLDTYEKALHNVLDFQTQVANASQLEWVSAIALAQAQFVTDVTTAYTKAARELLK